jgi:hydrogenase maturation factor HypF (carbamoyltransferase family)
VKREIVTLRGRVQGVGFRERVIEVACAHRVAGTVRNLGAGNALEIDVEGDDLAVEAFVAAVVEKRPFFARIDTVERRPADLRGVSGFARAPTG